MLRSHSAHPVCVANDLNLPAALVDVKGVTKRFGGLTAVSDVDLVVTAGVQTLRPGQKVQLLGAV